MHRFAEVVATPFALEHALINLARGEVVGPLHTGGDEAFVVAQIKISLCAVVGHKHFAMLKRAHGARIDVEIGVELDEGDAQAARFENRCERGRRDALAQRGHHTAGDEDELGHVVRRGLWPLRRGGKRRL